MRKLFLLYTFLSFFFTSIYSQSTTRIIDFNKCTDSQVCNTFLPARKCEQSDNYLIQTIYGAPKYLKVQFDDPLYYKDIVKKSVRFRSRYISPSTTFGDALAIEYDFTNIKYYKIDIVASSVPNEGDYIAPLRLNLDNFLVGSDDGCGLGDYNIPPTSYTVTGGINPFQPQIYDYLISNENTYTRTFSFFSPNDFDYLGIRAVPMSGYNDTLQSTVYKVVIKEHEYNISPKNLSISCNSAVDQTFTVTNTDNIPIDPSTLTFEWNLGQNNGWLLGGSPAPAIITTQANTLALSYLCGAAAPSNVSVTVKVNGVVYNTYTSTVTLNTSLPSGISIVGSNILCTSSPAGRTYSIPGLPCNSTVSWSLAWTPGSFNLVPSGNSVTIYPIQPVNNSSATLYATISRPCGDATISIPLFFSTSDCACNIPTNLTAITTPGSIIVNLSWDPISDIQYYEIQYEYYDCIYGTTQTGLTGSGTNTYMFYYAAPGTRVRYRVRARCSFGFFNDYSNWHDFIVPSSCSMPEGLSATPVGLNGMTLNWFNVPGATEYWIYTKYDAGSGYVINTPTVVGTNTYDFYYAPPNSTVQFAVKAKCDETFSAMSDCFQFILPGSCPPPNGGIATYSSGSGIYLYFPSFQQGVVSLNLKYRVYGTSTEFLINNIPRTSPYIFTNGVPGTIYQFAIQTICVNGATSTWGEWTTPAQYKNSRIDLVENDVLDTDKIINIYPNPANNKLHFTINSRVASTANVIVFNSNGVVVLNKQVHLKPGINLNSLNVGALNNGLYLLNVINGLEHITGKFVISK